VATAIANSEAHEQLAQLADEQAALRRVATLVAEGATPQRVFDAVRSEVATMFNTPVSMLMRYDDTSGTATLVTTAEDFLGPVGTSWPVEGDSSATAQVCRTGLPARADYTRPAQGPIAAAARAAGGRSAVGVPVVVDGALWGVVTVGTRGAEALPADVEGRLAKFTELLATAIANSEAHEQLALLADEQAALRRVATLVAEGATPHRVFDAVRGEVARMFNAPLSGLLRYDGNGTVTQLAASDDYLGPVETTWPVADDSSAVARVCRTGLPARADYTRPAQGSIAAAARDAGARSAVGVPVVVDGAFWGVMAVGTREAEPLPADMEDRLTKFTELLATAIANAEGRAEVDASRARIVATADATRRRIERDLHDGAQQQLVWLALAVRAAQATVPEGLEQHRTELGRVVDGLTAALDDLREIALGIHPAGLSEDGLTPALKRLVARSPLRVNLDCRADGRFPEPVEVTAYYVVSESLTNAAKHADTPVVDVAVAADGDTLRVEVRDDGRGGADPAGGSGLLGLKDRVEAIGGRMRLTSPPGAGTSLSIELPLRDHAVRR
jgi:signal transduction histidine kinase